jgi:hypothetical protein
MPEKIDPWTVLANTTDEKEFPFQNFTPGVVMEMEKYKKIFILLDFFTKFMHVSRERGKKSTSPTQF